jgi:predicted TIM-barrel fold metal-dependent hydrolase
VLSKLKSLGDERIQDMDKGDVSLQVISHGPLIASSSACLGANDELAVAISKNSKRLARFAMLLMQDPKAAARELARCVKELGFVGALVDNHLDGQFYDDERFWPVFEKAQDLDVPIYLHPTFATASALEHF